MVCQSGLIDSWAGLSCRVALLGSSLLSEEGTGLAARTFCIENPQANRQPKLGREDFGALSHQLDPLAGRLAVTFVTSPVTQRCYRCQAFHLNRITAGVASAPVTYVVTGVRRLPADSSDFVAVARHVPLVVGLPAFLRANARASNLEARYVNYLEVGFSDVEFILQFGQMQQTPNAPALIHTRLVAAPAVAREFARTLTASIEAFNSQQESGKESLDG